MEMRQILYWFMANAHVSNNILWRIHYYIASRYHITIGYHGVIIKSLKLGSAVAAALGGNHLPGEF